VKEFKGMEDRPSQQIKRLREILTELGMSGRMSLEQAKSIRAKRELAQELEDVASFGKKWAGEEGEKKGKSKNETSSNDEEEVPRKGRNVSREVKKSAEEGSDGEESEEVGPKRRKVSDEFGDCVDCC
jgi:hypothetical protein